MACCYLDVMLRFCDILLEGIGDNIFFFFFERKRYMRDCLNKTIGWE